MKTERLSIYSSSSAASCIRRPQALRYSSTESNFLVVLSLRTADSAILTDPTTGLRVLPKPSTTSFRTAQLPRPSGSEKSPALFAVTLAYVLGLTALSNQKPNYWRSTNFVATILASMFATIPNTLTRRRGLQNTSSWPMCI
jgi:hypothetical protein